MKMWKVVAALLAVFMIFGGTASAAFAKEGPMPPMECDEFYLRAVHGINGERLGLESELPVDVYVNGGYAFTFEWKDSVNAKLPAGEYTVDVKLAGTDTTVISLGPVEIDGCYKVVLKATLIDGAPDFKVKIRELMPK